ncbi:MAG: response regulator [Anaerolineae bacterium]|nr:response regulator [Anaerolineae bacterium]
MWYGLRLSPKADPDFVNSATELLRSTLRHIVIITGLFYLFWHFAATVTWPQEVGQRVWLITPIVALTFALSFWLLSRHLLAAQAMWQVGLATAITLAVYVFRQPEIAFFYVLLPLMAVVTVGWQGGLMVEGLVVVLLIGISYSSVMPALPTAYSLGIAIGGAFTGLLGWTTARSLLTVAQWSIFSYEQAWKNMEEAREQRLELRQTQQDLIQANRELARLTDRLKAMNQVAEEARRAKEEFVANVSHELRTPLNMIIGFSEVITQSPQVYGDKLPPALLADIAAIQRNSQHLTRLVNDVLDLSQIEAGRMALSKEWASLQEIIDAAVLAVQPLFDSKGLYLETEIAPDLPPLFCDSTRIRQVVLNLLSNAGRFTEQGGVRVHVHREKDDVVISVHDTGPGIAPEDQQKLFEPFRQVDGSIRRRHGGSGLGLSISKQFVEMHGGKVWLESEVDVGTTISFTIPLAPSSPAILGEDGAARWFHPHRQYERLIRRSKAPAPTVLPRFVLLEKGETMQRLFSRYLEGFEIVSVPDIEGATQELSHSPAQALVVNAPLFKEMPVSMDQLSDLPYGTPTVVCWVPGENEAARQLGVVRYLVKPVTHAELLDAVQDLGARVRNVLLVDDNPEALQLFARVLSSAERPYRVLRATNGQQALDMLRRRQPDVMLLDLMMPGMDGFQVLREKNQDPSIKDIPAIVISAKDPSGEPIVSDALTVTRSGGLSVRNLLDCIQAISSVLAPSGPPDDRGQPEKIAA